ncbi:Alpha-tocopherol transfer protein [Eumeta japonica]|uniref:Alpha-tocopherol transfer protein n=1 Tax=Eumeta variegata TaxID=151549 RepID=A0A4C1Z6E2_EUMVA|nr:Alpha-tocopherol transfer protein [Eumeta japonica]
MKDIIPCPRGRRPGHFHEEPLLIARGYHCLTFMDTLAPCGDVTLPYSVLASGSWTPIEDETKKEIRRIHEMDDEERLRDGVSALGEWCDKQHHFVEKNINKIQLEKRLILSKGSVEDAKIRIDRILIARGMMADLVLKRTPEEMTRLSRVTEYCHEFDYAVGARYVYDFRNFNLGMLAKLNPTVLKKVVVLAANVYGLKIKGIHLINAPSFVDKVVFLFKTVLSQKLAERIHVHSSYEDFHKHVSREVLPSDYGG